MLEDLVDQVAVIREDEGGQAIDAATAESAIREILATMDPPVEGGYRRPNTASPVRTDQSPVRTDQWGPTHSTSGHLHRPWLISGMATSAVVLLVVAMVLVKIAGIPSSSGADNRQAGHSSPAPATANAVAAATSVPVATLDTVGPGSYQYSAGQAGLQPVRGTPITAGARPTIVYEGAEYCPYCAAERWPLVVALSRFGTFSGLRTSMSSGRDVHPNTPTFTFAGARYTSNYVTFSPVELADRAGKPLQTPSTLQKTLLQTYDGAPYIPQRDKGAIPFLYLGGKYVSVGATYDQSVLDGKTLSAISGALADPSSPIAQGVDGSANALTAGICQATGGQPGPVCSSPGVRAMTSGATSGHAGR